MKLIMEGWNKFLSEAGDNEYARNRLLKKIYLDIKRLLDAAVEFYTQAEEKPRFNIKPKDIQVDGWKAGTSFGSRSFVMSLPEIEGIPEWSHKKAPRQIQVTLRVGKTGTGEFASYAYDPDASDIGGNDDL